MRSKGFVLYLGAGLLAGLFLQGSDGTAAAQAQADVRALYDRSASLNERTQNRVFNIVGSTNATLGSVPSSASSIRGVSPG